MLGFPVEAFGLSWWFDTSAIDDDLAQRLRALWSRAAPTGQSGPAAPPESSAPPALPNAASARRPFVIAPGSAPDPDRVDALIPEDRDAVPYAVSRAFTLAGIRQRTGEALMLHAVGVSDVDGHVVALVGKSGTGKTTAARHLGRRLGYVTDETVVIDADLRVWPYPKPLSIITEPTSAFAKAEFSPDELGLLHTADDIRLACVVVLERNPDAVEARFEAIGLVEAALAVLPETSALPRLKDPLDLLARALTGHGGPYRLVYAEIEQCLDVIVSLAAPNPERDATAPTWLHIRGADHEDLPPAGEIEQAAPAWDATLRRGRFTDAIVTEGEVLLLRDRRPVSLAGLGAQLWLACEQPISLHAFHDRAVAAIGAHPRSRALVIEAAHALLREDLLEVLDDEGRPVNALRIEKIDVPGP